MKWRHWSLLIVLLLLNYLVFSTAFTQLAARQPQVTPATRTPQPTYANLSVAQTTRVVAPTNTPWPTYAVPTLEPTATTAAVVTATRPVSPTLVATSQPTPLPTVATEPPTIVPSPTAPAPTATPRPARTAPPRPTRTPAPEFTGQAIWDPAVAPNCTGPAIAKLSMVRDAAGNPVNGAVVEVSCPGQVWTLLPSGTAGGYEPGHYEWSAGQPNPVDWACTARVVSLAGRPVTTSQVVSIRFDTNDCGSGGSGHQVAILNWTKTR
jgi:hypothetical protein